MKQATGKQEKNIQDVIAEHRKKYGTSYKFMAEIAKISDVELSHIKSGRRKTNAYVKKEKQLRSGLKKLEEARA